MNKIFKRELNMMNGLKKTTNRFIRNSSKKVLFRGQIKPSRGREEAVTVT